MYPWRFKIKPFRPRWWQLLEIVRRELPGLRLAADCEAALRRADGVPPPRLDATGESPPSPPPSTPHDRSRGGSGFTRNHWVSLQPEATYDNL